MSRDWSNFSTDGVFPDRMVAAFAGAETIMRLQVAFQIGKPGSFSSGTVQYCGMGKKSRMIVLALIALVLGTFTLLFLQPPQVKEPVYRGKPLGSWLDFGQPTADKIMPEVGTNAIPWLLHEASAHETGLVTVLKRLFRSVLRMYFATASERQDRAKRGFYGLGSAGGLAVTQGLTNSNPWIRFGCVGQWEIGKAYAGQYIPNLIDRLKDPDRNVRARAANALGLMGQQEEKIVPALIQSLDDQDQNVRCMAALGLSCIGKKAKAAVPSLRSHLSNCTPDFEFWATNALKAIGPVASASANTNSSSAK
jgi:hypothetical protein